MYSAWGLPFFPKSISVKRGPKDKYDVRFLYVTFVLSFFELEDAALSRDLLTHKVIVDHDLYLSTAPWTMPHGSWQAFVSHIFSELVKDKNGLIAIIIRSLHKHVVLSNLSRKQKMIVFTPYAFSQLSQLYEVFVRCV